MKKKFSIDARGVPSPVCPNCGCMLLRITVQFELDNYEISGYLLDDAECASCGCLITAPTPIDHID